MTVRLTQAPPHAVVEAVTAALATVDDGARCTVFLADHRLDELRPVGAGSAAPAPRIEGTEHGRCFAAQQVLGGGDRPLLVPVSAHGDRLGVLEIRSGEPGEPGYPAEGGQEGAVRALGAPLGQALLAADRVTDVYRKVRRGRSLTLSAELQWDLLPGRSLDAGYAVVAGQLEPAYSVVGDVYDWAADATGLTAVLVDGAGQGVEASGNAAFAVAALRNARREGAGVADMARMADQALHARHRGELFSSAVLLHYDPARGALDVVVAGAGTLLHVGRRGVRLLDLDRDPPLGAEEEYPYRAVTVPLAAGERIVVAGDGIWDAQVGGEVFGRGLAALVHSLRLLGPGEVVRALVRELGIFHGDHPQQDDAVVLCLDTGGGTR